MLAGGLAPAARPAVQTGMINEAIFWTRVRSQTHNFCQRQRELEWTFGAKQQ